MDLWSGVTSRLKDSLEKVGLCTAESIILLSIPELCKLASLSEEDCNIILTKAAEAILPKGFISGHDLEKIPQHTQRLSVGCPNLDKFLRGGIRTSGITEIAGESGSGKTQLCLQMSLAVQFTANMGGLNAGCIYICTEHAFPSQRHEQLIHTFPKRFSQNQPTDVKFSDNVLLYHIADNESLKKCLYKQVPKLLKHRHIKLLIIDSIAGVYRSEFELQDTITRATELRCVGGQLHRLAQEYNVAVVVVNQVTGIPSSVGTPGQTVAALGLAWANMVTTRLQLSRVHSESSHRTMEIIFSPELPPEHCYFTVNNTGVIGIDDTDFVM